MIFLVVDFFFNMVREMLKKKQKSQRSEYIRSPAMFNPVYGNSLTMNMYTSTCTCMHTHINIKVKSFGGGSQKKNERKRKSCSTGRVCLMQDLSKALSFA